MAISPKQKATSIAPYARSDVKGRSGIARAHRLDIDAAPATSPVIAIAIAASAELVPAASIKLLYLLRLAMCRAPDVSAFWFLLGLCTELRPHAVLLPAAATSRRRQNRSRPSLQHVGPAAAHPAVTWARQFSISPRTLKPSPREGSIVAGN
ncbi:hypothetical protein PHYPSEUDO_010538 [Phytophthora pseudosyringae]|uniref:Uncharacterized protein n=1 Tax=Phytophthora pseudosyringae TaxID=221518 RepID=A0A8T1VD24_9STRA|nr:hypothetical protein PHYPSEUDO_010538 [Phytophthora pseudosyringae]